MTPGWTRRGGVVFLALAALPGVVTAQPLGPETVASAPPSVRAVASFVLVGVCGGALLARSGSLVDRAVDDTMAAPALAVVYGLGAYVFVLFVGFYANNLFLQFGVTGTPLGSVAGLVLLGGLSLLCGFGYAVVGTLLTDLYAERRPWLGLLVGSAIGAVGWFVLPALFAFAAWVVVAAFGVGGPTRTWFHSDRGVPAERHS